MKRLHKQNKRARNLGDWHNQPKKAQDKKFDDKKDLRRVPRKQNDEDKMDWRDILMEEGDDFLNDR